MPELPNGDLLIEHVRLYRGPGDAPEDGAQLLVLDGRVAARGATPPADVPRLDGTGWVALPGLIEAHTHLPHADPGAALRGYLRDGVTTVRSASNSFDELRRAREGDAPRPRLLACGPGLMPPGGHPVETAYAGRPEMTGSALPVHDADSVAAAVERLAEGGARYLKVYLDDGAAMRMKVPKLSYRLLDEAVNRGREHGLPAMVHCSTEDDYRAAIDAGAHEVCHVISAMLKPWLPRELGRRIAEAGLFWTPTLHITEAFTRLLAGPAGDLAWGYMERAVRRYLVEFRRAGGVLVAGSDSADTYESYEGALPREIALLASVAALSPRAALATATEGAAAALSRPDLGDLRAGARGDVALFKGDPVGDLAHLARPAATVVAGRVAWTAAGVAR